MPTPPAAVEVLLVFDFYSERIKIEDFYFYYHSCFLQIDDLNLNDNPEFQNAFFYNKLQYFRFLK
jgi:hypothetical protein